MRPNIVFIISDNQSPWSLGCYGNREILTPNIDRLSREGVRFTNSFCSNPVCSPNRATCLTGLMPSQHGVHSWLGIEKPDAQMGEGAYSTIKEFPSLPGLLADAGYRCAMTGKWHLGDSLNPQSGFDYWFAKPRGHTRSFYGAEAIWQGKAYREPGYYLDAITGHAVDFLEESQGAPFFLYVGYNAPYGLDGDLRKGHRNRHARYYSDRSLGCFPRVKPHPWLRGNRDCVGNETAMRSYSAAVSGVDDGVGKILEALARLNLEKDTLVIYTADHGFCGGHHGFWGMSDHGLPLTMFEENLRIPLIMRHTGKIPAGLSCAGAVCNYDFLPSLLDYAGLPFSVAGALPLAGRSFTPLLAGESFAREEEITFHEYENTRTIRTPSWKFTKRFPGGPHDLYNIRSDPGEWLNLVCEPRYDGIKKDLESRLDAFFKRYAEPEYDIFKGGRSKAGKFIHKS